MMPSLEKKSGPRILVVDDEPNEMRSLVIGLRLEGFDAVGAPSAAEALELLDKAQFSLVIIDLMMPEMNGLQLARTIRGAHPDVTTLLMSAYHLSPVQLARADTGVAGFVPKPFSFDELVRFINSKLKTGVSSEVGESHYLSDSGLNAPVEVPSLTTPSANLRVQANAMEAVVHVTK